MPQDRPSITFQISRTLNALGNGALAAVATLNSVFLAGLGFTAGSINSYTAGAAWEKSQPASWHLWLFDRVIAISYALACGATIIASVYMLMTALTGIGALFVTSLLIAALTFISSYNRLGVTKAALLTLAVSIVFLAIALGLSLGIGPMMIPGVMLYSTYLIASAMGFASATVNYGITQGKIIALATPLSAKDKFSKFHQKFLQENHKTDHIFIAKIDTIIDSELYITIEDMDLVIKVKDSSSYNPQQLLEIKVFDFDPMQLSALINIQKLTLVGNDIYSRTESVQTTTAEIKNRNERKTHKNNKRILNTIVLLSSLCSALAMGALAFVSISAIPDVFGFNMPSISLTILAVTISLVTIAALIPLTYKMAQTLVNKFASLTFKDIREFFRVKLGKMIYNLWVYDSKNSNHRSMGKGRFYVRAVISILAIPIAIIGVVMTMIQAGNSVTAVAQQMFRFFKISFNQDQAQELSAADQVVGCIADTVFAAETALLTLQDTFPAKPPIIKENISWSEGREEEVEALIPDGFPAEVALNDQNIINLTTDEPRPISQALEEHNTEAFHSPHPQTQPNTSTTPTTPHDPIPVALLALSYIALPRGMKHDPRLFGGVSSRKPQVLGKTQSSTDPSAISTTPGNAALAAPPDPHQSLQTNLSADVTLGLSVETVGLLSAGMAC